jgi:Bacterial Ig domain
MNRRIAHAASLLALTLALGLALFASPAVGARIIEGPSSCAQAAPAVAVDNTWGWAQWGSWGRPGQERMYSVHVINNDVGCGSSSFVISLSAPDGFSVSIPTSTITLNSRSSGYLSAHVTSPAWAPDGDNPLNVTVRRAQGDTQQASTTSYYKVYSSDSALPTLFWPNPGDGTWISGRSYNVTVSSSDDHQVTKIELYIDNDPSPRTTTTCDGVAYTCQLNYKWSIRRVHGQHSATFKSYDHWGNVGDLTVNFTVN